MSIRVSTSVCAFAGLLLATLVGCAQAEEKAVAIPAPAFDEMPSSAATATATFAGGCFWGVQGVFQRVQGVLKAVSGYAGGKQETAHYETVGGGTTGHAETVQIAYDPSKITYGKLLQIYFSVAHDPTQLNRQDPDSGPQYRSAVFYADAAQKETTDKYIAQLDAAKSYPRKIVTQVVPLTAFYAAEGYHQDYLTLHPESGYIARFDMPKIANLKAMFPQQYRAEPALVMARAKP
jgi:peptide-methionine (S)-S-oxide reductase